MTMFLPNRKATILVPSGPIDDPERKHLFILLSDPVNDEQLVLMVSISSVKPNRWNDDACLLYKGDHPFIIKDSFVDYSSARIEPESKLINGVDQGYFVPREPVSQEIFERICAGVMASRRTPKDIKRFFLIHCTE
tara:strand:- start:2915 stop:3322 length:408 start_codon:yes stop_codon:yes gene_type:complete